MRIYLDESVNPKIADGLRRRGVESITTQDADQLGVRDDDQVAFADQLSAILLTHDTDFLKIADTMKRKGVSHPGVIYVHPQKYGIGTIVKKVAAIAKANTPEAFENHIIFL